MVKEGRRAREFRNSRQLEKVKPSKVKLAAELESIKSELAGKNHLFTELRRLIDHVDIDAS